MSEPGSPFPTALEWEPQPQPGVWVIPAPRRRWWLYGLFFVLTMFSTTVVGARMQFHYIHNQPLFLLDEDFFFRFLIPCSPPPPSARGPPPPPPRCFPPRPRPRGAPPPPPAIIACMR